MKTPWLTITWLCISCLLTGNKVFSADRYWVHKIVYENFFSTPAEIADWQLIEDDGTGGFVLSGTGTAILTMDDAAGGFANRLFNVNGASPRLMPFDAVNGRMELLVKSITGGNQRIFLQAQEFDGSGTYLGQVNILPAQSAIGFFSVDLNTVIWDPSTVQVRFIVGGENYSAQQGTVEFAYFSYSNTNGSWDNAANWSTTSNGPGGASIPGALDNAIFDGGGNSNGSCLLDINASINSISVTGGFSGNIDLQNFQMTIGAGGVTLAGGGITGDANIQVYGSVFISGGAFDNPPGNTYVSGDITITGGILDFGSGTIILNGSSDQQFNSSVITPVNNLIINKPSGAVNFNSDILVADSLVLTQGILNTNGNTVRLGTSAADTGVLISGNGKINGNFARWISPASSGNILFPLGNTASNAPLTVQVIGAPSSGGVITAAYTDAAPGYTAVNFMDNSATITQVSTASWVIQTIGISDGSYSLSLSDDHLAAASSLANLDLTLANGVVGTFQPATGTLSDPTLNRSGLTASNLANAFFAGVGTIPLPVTWLTFDVSRQGETVTWNWSLALEENVSRYEPQYSLDGVHFITAGKITQLNSDHIYSFSAPVSPTGTIFFRIREVDMDGKASYSIIKAMSSTNTTAFSLSPNPVLNELTLHWPYGDATIIHTIVTDSQGKRILERNDAYAPSLTISFAGIPAGSYFIRCNDDKEHQPGASMVVKLSN